MNTNTFKYDVQNPNDQQLLQSFVGGKSEYYLAKWKHCEGWNPTNPSSWKLDAWSWCGALVTMPWLLYRKMYQYAGVYFLAGIVIYLVESALGINASGRMLISLLLIIYSGFNANYFYRLHAEKNIDHSIQSGLQNDDLKLKIAESGGVNIAVTWIFAVISIIIIIISFLGGMISALSAMGH